MLLKACALNHYLKMQFNSVINFSKFPLCLCTYFILIIAKYGPFKKVSCVLEGFYFFCQKGSCFFRINSFQPLKCNYLFYFYFE